MRIGKIAMGSYMVNMVHGVKPDELKSPEKTAMAKRWLRTAEKGEGNVTAEKCDNKPENITFRTEDWLDRTWAEAKKTNPEETAQPEDPSKGKLNITHIPGNFSFGPRITEQWVAVGSTDKVRLIDNACLPLRRFSLACFVSWPADWVPARCTIFFSFADCSLKIEIQRSNACQPVNR